MALSESIDSRPVDVWSGNLRIRLAANESEIEAAQALRYRVFCAEMGATPTAEMAAVEREYDSFDDYCDHLLVFDENHGGGVRSVVGTYRLMRREAAARRGRFYSADEYDISGLLAYPGGILEVGRSCVDRYYRDGATMQLLWRGIASYVFYHDIDILFGCASLPGVGPEPLALPLSYLYHHHLAPPSLRPRARPERYVAMDSLAPGAIDRKEALRALPPLIKGYLRLGGSVGDGAVVDEDFRTTDVCVVVKTDMVTEKYQRHYIRDNEARAGDKA
jgi:putative hemolysin